MMLLIYLALGLVAVTGTMVIVTRQPARQAVMLSVYGLVLAILFVTVQAPDVALSQLAIGTAVVPLMIMLTIQKVSGRR
ncbi:MAG TPA: hydrogenase subunit MbhD domain-containing protein [Pseudonocardiaceae bacterium]|nr:hydrogenase subunit MbhD domain-containing protein [Pseudonocardiaceae bacterium]